MSLQVIIFLLLFGGVQTILFSLFLVRKKLHHSAYLFLLLYLGVIMLQITLKVMSKIWLMGNWPVLYSFSHFLPLLYGPLIFLFIKYLLQRPAFNGKELAHFIPAAIVFSILILEHFIILPEGLLMVMYNPYIRLFFIMVSLSVYHMLAFRIIALQKKSVTTNTTVTTSEQIDWARHFIIGSAVVTVVVSLALFLLYINYPNGHQFRFGFILLSIFIYWMSYKALSRPSVFSVVKGYARRGNAVVFAVPQLVVYRQNEKYANSRLSDEECLAISNKLHTLMQKDKMFLQPNYSINQLADAVQCSRHHLSQVLNDKLHLSFNDYINGLRIEEARRLLLDPKCQQYKISSIAYDAGFNSLSTFNEVFRKHTGKTPSDYRKELLKQEQKQRV